MFFHRLFRLAAGLGLLSQALLASAATNTSYALASSEGPGQQHVVRLLDEHDHALAQRLAALDDAQLSIDISTFIIEPDPVALDFLWHVREAAQRGVRVRLLVDARFYRLPRETTVLLVSSGVSIRQYHPFRWYKPGWINTRLHDKMQLTDAACTEGIATGPGETAATGRASMILGGRNLSQPYFGTAGRLPRAYVDRDVEVEGPATEAGCRYFEALWSSSQTRWPRMGRWDPARSQQTCDRHPRISRGGCQRELLRRDRAVAAALTHLTEAHSATRHPQPKSPPPTFEVDSIDFLADPVGDKDLDLPVVNRLFRQGDRIGPQLLEVLARAKTSVVIESPYLVPSRGFRNAVRQTRQRGLEIRILTNSLLTTDNLLPQAAYRNAQSWLLKQGIDLWEYAGEESMHAKSAVLDGRISIVGSYNLDPRSEHLNTEIALVIDDEAFASALLASLDRRLEQSWNITKDGIANLGPDNTLRYPGVSRSKRRLMTLLRLITPLLKRQI